MKILILGSGGREHALAWKIKQSPLCSQLFVAPGNAGTREVATNVPMGVNDFQAIMDFVLKEAIELVIVGPEEPLVRGIRDAFDAREELKHVLIVGPGKEGAQLEGSKDFSKQFMARHQIPTARYKTFTADQLEEGLEYIDVQEVPIVLKADGLAAGKGVIIAQSHKEAHQTLTDMLANQKFGDASSRVVIEQFLDGIELSVFVLTDGKTYKILPEAKDYKRIGEGDTGLNTGGMGAVSPVPFVDSAFMQKVEERIIRPTVEGLKSENISYIGFIFFGLINVKGEPYVIEYNARMGDPETEVVIPRIQSDLVELLVATAAGNLSEKRIQFVPRVATTVMLVSGGYPGDYDKGKVITELHKAENVLVFHAGTKVNAENRVVTDGGRVMALTAYGADIRQAIAKSNLAAERIQWDGKYYRKDIGLDLLKISK
jgi:phosphoribosylamine--glycine ligase